MLIKCNRIYTSDGVKSGFLKVENGKFAGVVDCAGNEEFLDFSEQRIIPGIIDTHNHGTMGYGLRRLEGYTDEDVDYNVRNYLKALTLHGVTGILPTADFSVFKNIKEITDGEYEGARVLGIHSEGPYGNRVGEKGRPRPCKPVDLDHVKQAIEDAGGLLCLLDVAPEVPGTDELIELLKENNITIGFFHSNCNYEETKAAIEKGITVATHLSNVMTGLHHRDIGGTGALLTSDKVECELICDGLHVSLPYIELLFKCKDYSRFMMISDSSNLAGIAPGEYPGHYQDVKRYVDTEGFIKDSDGRISGSTKAVLYGIGNLVEKLNIPMETVVKMASLNPAVKYGWGERKGSIEEGKDADFVIIDDKYTALRTYIEGECAFDIEKDVIEFNPKFEF